MALIRLSSAGPAAFLRGLSRILASHTLFDTTMLITNARLVNEGRISEGDLRIKDQRIDKIAPSISAHAGEPVFDAAGRLLLPGMIDAHVHFREPGMEHKADFESESAAAVAGGVTAVMDMPNNNPPAVTRTGLAAKYERAKGRMRTNYAFYFGATNDNLAEIEALQPGETCGLKIFMGCSTGNLHVDDPQALDTIFARCPTLIATHCEDTPMIEANAATARARYGEDVPFREHPNIRSVEACYRSTQLAVGLAKKHGAQLHVPHLTTARELEFFKPGPVAGKQLTTEACVHHLFLDASRYDELGAKMKCNPAIKSAADRTALVQAVCEGRVDTIATDHAPHTRAEKARSYFKAPSGLPLIQHAVLILFELIERGELELATVVERACHAPAIRFKVADRGFLREGYYADLALVNPGAQTRVSPDNIRYKCGWSPFEGHTFPARVDATWVNGQLAWCDGELSGGAGGQRLDLS
ncbi:MAG: dihydroorotase [Sinobacteraceae bacterium]|nr:dihydroorotase [Nevskiaceae bacterium]